MLFNEHKKKQDDLVDSHDVMGVVCNDADSITDFVHMCTLQLFTVEGQNEH